MCNSRFRIKESRYVPAVRSTVTLAEDRRSGAVLIHLRCEEEREHFFSACFRTPPMDDTGVPHIIEHTVLNGSAKYPVKDPFMEMVKSSMATFINAMTYGDRTVYPCGSLNEQDFFNLVSVYMDAVFNPLLREEYFQQEGYRLDYEAETGKLTHNGVVYNEMKGAYSDPDSYIEREVMRLLYPEGSCGKDSGGDPPEVTSLTYKHFLDFYENHYNPGNCCIFALTPFPFGKFADFIGPLIPQGKPRRAGFILQPDLPEPVYREVPVPGNGDGCTVLRAWKVNDAGDPVETLAFSLLEDVLLEDDSSPLRAALIDSNLGTGLAASGYDYDPFQRNFITGLKGVERKNAGKILTLVGETLESLAEKGLKKELVRSMLHRKELSLKYIGSGWPMSIMSASTAAWTHGEDIFQTLDLSGLLKGLRDRLESNERFLEGMIRSWLLENPHRADLVFYPDEDHFEEEDLRTSSELAERKSRMSEEELLKLARKSEALRNSMERPNSPEELSTLPKLHLSEIPSAAATIFHRETDTGNGIFLEMDIHTADVCYVDLALDLSGMPDNLVPFASFYADLMTRTGADGMGHIELAEEELACSGGINALVKCGTDSFTEVDEYRLVLKVSGYCLKRDLEGMLGLMKKRLLSPDVGNCDRIASVAGEMAEHEKSSMIPRGHTISMLAARSGLSRGHFVANLLNGTPSLKLLSSINKKNAAEHAEALLEIRRFVASGLPGTLAWTGPDSEKSRVLEWMSTLPLVTTKGGIAPWTMPFVPSSVGIKTGPGTCFAAGALPGLALNHPLAPSGAVMLRMLSEGYLWDEIRVKRGAYGAGAGLAGGAVNFYSYRDPSPFASLQLFLESAEYGFKKLDLTRRSIEDSIIAGLKSTDPPVRPAMANGMALMRHLRGLTKETAEHYRSGLLGVTADSIKEFGNWLSSSTGNMRTCVTGSRECLASASVEEITEL